MAYDDTRRIIQRGEHSTQRKKVLRDAFQQAYADNNDIDGDLHLDIGSGEGIKIGVDPASTFGWADITTEITLRGVAATDPTWAQISTTGFFAYNFAVADEVWMTFHVPHDIVPGTDIHFHAHWLPDGTDTNTVKWEWRYAYAKGFNQAAFDLAALTTDAGTITAEQAGPGVAYQHMVTETAAVTLAGLTEPDGMVMVNLARITNGGTNNTDGIFLLTSDIHYQTTGLNATLNKAPNFYA